MKDDPRPLFLWVHFFDAHEEDRRHDGFSFGRGEKGAYESEQLLRETGRLVASRIRSQARNLTPAG